MNDRQPSTAVERQVAQMSDLVVDHEKILMEALPEGMPIRQVMRDALQMVQKTPKLAECYGLSVIGGLVNCAQLGLRPGVGALGHAWLLPMWNNRERRMDATLVIGYRGYVALGYRDPAVQAIAAHCVFTNDSFKHVLHGARGVVEHIMAEGDRGLPAKYYGAAVVRGVDILTETWTQAEMNAHRDRYALAKNRDGKLVGPWALGRNGEITTQAIEMSKKTMIRVPLAKMIPATWHLSAAGAIDDGGVREDIDPTVEPVEATVHPNRPEEQPEADPTEQVRESVTIRQTFPTGGLTGDQDREIAGLVRDRKMSRDAALDLVEQLFGERKSARQLTEEQAAKLIAALNDVPLPTMEGDVLTPGRPVAEQEPAQPPALTKRKPTKAMMNMIHAALAERGITDDDAVRAEIGRILKVEIASRKDVTFDQAARVLDHLDAPDPAPAGSPEQLPGPPMPGKDELVREHIVELIRAEWARAGGTPQALAGAFRKAMNVGHREATVNELNAFLQQFRAGKHQPSSAAARQRTKLLAQISGLFDGLDEHLSPEDRLADMSRLLNRPVTRLQDLTAEEADTIAEVLGGCAGLVKTWDDGLKAAEAAWAAQQ